LAEGFDGRIGEVLAYVYSCLIVYRPETKPVQIAAILHGHRDIHTLLKDRL